MSIIVRYATQIRTAVGFASDTVELEEPCTICEVIQQLAARHGTRLNRTLFDKQGQILPSVMVCVNDKHILDPRDHVLDDGDEIFLVSAISGG